MKPRGGFSYIEMIIALSLFAVLILASLPLLNQAALNLGFAQDGYRAHLAAQSIMLAVRDSSGIDAKKDAAEVYAQRLGIDYYTVSVFSRGNPEGTFFGSPNSPSKCTSIDGFSYINFAGKKVVVVVIFSACAQVIGRAVGIIAD
ncbi:MAG: prepilin-type N-terminal cleavage/methylation domain-containing protein [Defluviitaleaceae bacterium]|nr:prepilin-type N-terminal cleavage/methylation domain-containing protein [Defluviitaleaceae bacterium]